MSASTRWRWAALSSAGLVVLLLLPLGAGAADLSLLSDFGQPDIPTSTLGINVGTRAGHVAGIYQEGDANDARIEQAGRGNHAEVWQIGSNNSADVLQRGTDNELRLSQAFSGQLATLVQDGIGNQVAIQQLGVNASVNSSQVGDGNQLVLRQQANSQFISTQTGTLNQIVVDLPAGMALRVDQVGNGLSFSLHPN
jgi:minor curlin subunit